MAISGLLEKVCGILRTEAICPRFPSQRAGTKKKTTNKIQE